MSFVKNTILLSIVGALSATAGADTVQKVNVFNSGEVISSSAMNENFDEIKKAVDGNDSKISAIEAQLNEPPAPDCAGNNASDVMVKAGTLCVDKYKSSLWSSSAEDASAVMIIDGTCLPNGNGCDAIFAQSREFPDGAVSGAISYSQASAACMNVGKRLLTPAEWLMVSASPELSSMHTIDNMELVMGFKESDPAVGGKLVVGYIGPRSAAGGEMQYLMNITYDEAKSNRQWMGFRCAK